MVAKLALRDFTTQKEVKPEDEDSDSKDIDTSISTPAFELEKNLLLAVGNTQDRYQAICVFQCYLSAEFKQHLETEVFPGILAIEGVGSTELLWARELRIYYRNLLKLQAGLNIQDERISCSEEEMRKFLELLAALEELEAAGALNAIKSKNKIKDITTDIRYYTDVISVLPQHACEIVYEQLSRKQDIQKEAICAS
ncbi:hypothetical protein ENBRE01_3293 [Enteropsectra breve]|nr:hypothetical protein ENBRE01_3293 [Enteropsectra breve]